MCGPGDDMLNKQKVFYHNPSLSLHYPPSVVSITSCYPALFIGNLKHIFLDGIGDQNDNLNVKYWIRLACHRNNSNTNKGLLSFPSLRKLLPKAIIHELFL